MLPLGLEFPHKSAQTSRVSLGGTSRIFPGALPGHSDHQIPLCDFSLSSIFCSPDLAALAGGAVEGSSSTPVRPLKRCFASLKAPACSSLQIESSTVDHHHHHQLLCGSFSWKEGFRSNTENRPKNREAKPGGFQTGGFPTVFGKGPDCVADPFGTVPRRCS